MVGGLYEYPEVVGRPSRMSGNGRKTHPDVAEWWKALLNVRQLLGGPADIWEALSDVRKSRKILLNVREWSGGLPDC